MAGENQLNMFIENIDSWPDVASVHKKYCSLSSPNKVNWEVSDN